MVGILPFSPPDESTVFLVSGGAKGITADCVVALARRYRCRFVLVGRTPYDGGADPDWAEGVEDATVLKHAAVARLGRGGDPPALHAVQAAVAGVLARREIRGTLEDVATAGGTAVYVAADVTDGEALRRAVMDVGGSVGRVNGIIHGAGVLADRLVHQKSLTDFDRVLSVKIDGLQNLLACIPFQQLEYLVLFSSVAAFYGNAGQADYAAANEILNKVAHWVRAHAPRCRVLAIDWGPWDGGMVTPELKRRLKAMSVEVIAVDEGTRVLGDLLQVDGDVEAHHAQVIVGAALSALQPLPAAEGVGVPGETHRIRRRLSLAANPFLLDHVIGGRAVLPTVCAVSWMVNTCEELHPGYQFLQIDDYRVLKGIVFDQELAETYVLDLTTQPSSDPSQVVLESLIWSQCDDGMPRYHYRAQITLRRPAPDGVGSGALSDARGAASAAHGATPADHRLYHDGTLFHGDRFQGIDAILSIDESGLTMRVALPPLSWSDQGQFAVRTFNPYLVDVHLQSLLVWARRYVGYGGLPLRIEQGIQYGAMPFGEPMLTTMRVRSRTRQSLVADVEMRNSQDAVCLVVKGAEITLSHRLNALFLENRLDSADVGMELPNDGRLDL